MVATEPGRPEDDRLRDRPAQDAPAEAEDDHEVDLFARVAGAVKEFVDGSPATDDDTSGGAS
jgi:hypothetical protein